MIPSGLAAKVMVNGFLPTFYQLRIEGLLSEDEIVQIRDVLADLEILDSTTEQFDDRLRAVVAEVADQVEARIRRIAVMSILLAFTVAVASVAGALWYRAFRRAERLRQRDRTRLRRDYLTELFAGGDDQRRQLAERSLGELGLGLPFQEEPLVLCVLRYDRIPDREAPPVEDLFDLVNRVRGPDREAFPGGNRSVAVLLDARAGDEAVRDFLLAAREDAEARGQSLSYAMGVRFGPAADRGAVFDDLLARFSRRYLHGPGASIEGEETVPESSYEYPSKTEEALGKRIMEGDTEGAKRLVAEMLDRAVLHPPATVRAVVARLSSALFADIERLERAAGFSLPSASVDRLSELVLLDTVGAVRERLDSLLDEIAAFTERRRSDRFAETAARVDALIASNYRDPNLSSDTIADTLGLSAGYLGRSYRKLKGYSVSDAVNEVRLQDARKLLEETELTVDGVAISVGITNAASFYRLFKTRYGITPSEARANVLSSLRTGSPDAGS